MNKKVDKAVHFFRTGLRSLITRKRRLHLAPHAGHTQHVYAQGDVETHETFT